MLTQQQIAMAGVFNTMPNTVTSFYTRRILRGKVPFITNMTTISFESIKDYARKARILQRGAEFPIAKLNGSELKAVTPEVIKESVPFYAYDQLNRQAGTPIYINGKQVDNRTYERDRRIATIKNSIQTTMEEISAGILCKGAYKSADTGNEIKFTYPSDTSVTYTDIKEWSTWLISKVNEFSKVAKMQPSEILAGEKVFNKILADYNAMPHKVTNITTEKVKNEDGQWELRILLNGIPVTLAPNPTDTEGKSIDISEKIIMYHDLAFLPAYAGLVNVVNGQSTMEAIDVLLRETKANEETGEAKTLGESAYCPLIVAPKLIKVFKITSMD